VEHEVLERHVDRQGEEERTHVREVAGHVSFGHPLDGAVGHGETGAGQGFLRVSTEAPTRKGTGRSDFRQIKKSPTWALVYFA